MKATLTQLGVDQTTYVLVDGSGLSRKDLVSPFAFVQILRAMRRSPQVSVYLASLPVAGRSGTLKIAFFIHRLKASYMQKLGQWMELFPSLDT